MSAVSGGVSGALSGAGIGTAINPGVGTVIGGLAGGGLGILASLFGDDGAKQAAAAQQAIAEQQLAFQKETQKQAQGFAAPTMQELLAIQDELSQLSRLYTLQQAAYTRDSNLVNSIDPNIISAGQNAYDILNGKAAPTLDPISKQRDQQKRQLQTQLAQTLGPGYASSSAGLKALNDFDLQTNSLMTQAQQSYLGTLGTLTSQFSNARPNLGAEVNQNATTMGNLSGQIVGQLGNFQQRQINATIGTNPAPYGGASSVGAGVLGQYQASQGAQLQGTLATLGGAALPGLIDSLKPSSMLKLPDLSYGGGADSSGHQYYTPGANSSNSSGFTPWGTPAP